MAKNFSSDYRKINIDHFPKLMEISFHDEVGKQTLSYQRVDWEIDGVKKGLRYGENPGQEAALYKLINGNLNLGEVSSILPGRYLASEIELLQSGKHPGKINITDVDNALNIMRYFSSKPCCVIVKHNNPCGAAIDDNLAGAYIKALMADRIAAFGGAVALNREVDRLTAELIVESYSEVVAAPEFAEGVIEIFEKKKNLRVMKIGNMDKLSTFIGERYLDAKSLMDGGIIMQWSFVPKTLTTDDFYPAEATFKDIEYKIKRTPSPREYEDMLFGWLVETGVTSNSVIYVKEGVTVGIGTGEQDRVGVASIARDKAYLRYTERLCWNQYGISFSELKDKEKRETLLGETEAARGGLEGSIMVSDAFFPFRDGIDIGLAEGVCGVVQPGGGLRDFECIEACNEKNATMVFTGQRSFKH